MGKKEKEISKQNAEYYKEVNECYDDTRENEYDIIQYENDLQIEADQTLFDDVVSDIQKGLMQYATEESLPLCENLDLINLENYINFLLCGCPATRKKIERIEPEHEVDYNDYIEPEIENEDKTADEIEDDIKNIKTKIIESLGEELLLASYNKDLKASQKQGQKLIELSLSNFRKLSIKTAGVFLYWKTVYSEGLREYNRCYN